MAEDATTTTAAAALPAAQPDHDPIFAAIAAHAATLDEIQDPGALEALNELEGRAHDDAVAAMCEREGDAAGDLLHTMPTTLPGVVALLQHLGRTHPSSQKGASLLFEAHDSGWTDAANEWARWLAEAVSAMAGEAGR